MKDSGAFIDKIKDLFGKKQTNPAYNEEPDALQTGEEENSVTVKEVITVLGRVIFRLRKVFMSVPVVYYALKLAAYNSEHLPEMVGINLQSTGEYAQMIARESAVTGPLMVTAAALFLMFISRKSVYPWLISIFTLVLPLLLLFTSNYPA